MSVLKIFLIKPSTAFYFKVLNFNRINEKTDLERSKSMHEESDNEYNNDLDNEYFENCYFYSDAPKEIIEFQVFLTRYLYFVEPKFYENVQLINDYYKEKYQTPYFFSMASEEELIKTNNSVYLLENYLNLDDFKSVILPNLKLKLISYIYISQLVPNRKYVFFNFDFFEEIHMSPNGNSFIRCIETIPHDSRHSSYHTEEDARINATNAMLENASSTPHTTLKGLCFDPNRLSSKILVKDSYLGKPKVTPAIRNLRALGDKELYHELEVLLKELERRSMKPFEIVST